MKINLNQIPVKEIQKAIGEFNEQINWHMAHKNFAQVIGLISARDTLQTNLTERGN